VERAKEDCAAPLMELRRDFAKGFAGSPAFIAPEVIKGEPAKGYSSDWYSLGVCIFRLACGRMPYDDLTADGVLAKGKSGQIAWERLSKTISRELLDLMVGLLELDPARRYGSIGGGRRVMRHPYFAGVDWENINARSSPLADRNKAIDTGPMTSMYDRNQAFECIRNARHLLQGRALGPKQSRMGGWRGMQLNNASQASGQPAQSTAPPDESSESNDVGI